MALPSPGIGKLTVRPPLDLTSASPYSLGRETGTGTLMATKISDRIDALEQRLKQLKTQQQRMENRKRTQTVRRERREELRRRILVGTIVLAKVQKGEIEAALLESWLEGALTKEEDRKLFGLSAR